MKEDVKNYTLEELKNYFKSNEVAAYTALQIFNWIYSKRVESFDLMTNVSKKIRNLLLENFYFSKLKTAKRETSFDKTEKFLFELPDGAAIESVFIPETSRLTLCLSSQVGCKYSCKFCTSGTRGLKRNLTAGEIVNQYLAISDLTRGKITNIVFMGIGEPLDNFINVVKAIKIFSEHKGLDFSRRRISVSTCGIIPQIEELLRLKLGVKLSVSLHSADNAIRSKIMPVNQKYPLNELMKTLRSFSKAEKYPVTFEYALFGSLNTSRLDAQKLIQLLKGMDCKINLIPYNTAQGIFKEPSSSEIEGFCSELKRAGLFYTLRKSRGQDIKAACGQLYALWG
ncbi:MAG: 23S rRNA (adenine(2503)-C(2))-methyltransferase RlmN [Candidatus Omnitrophica bacterium]|nr:23S rRNA (adenine(2503)-C(2))-methyltransferase RlmN [Candidatus Omnitrophota bacterium]